MEKTKLGISVCLTAALLYFLGLVNLVALVVAAGYVLLAEKDAWLRKAAVQALAIALGYQLFDAVLGVGGHFFAFLNSIVINFAHAFSINYPFRIDNILLSLAWILQAALLLVLGFMALAHKGFHLPLLGDFADKHLGLPQRPKAVQPQAVYPQPGQGYPYGQQGYPVQQAPGYPPQGAQPYAAPQAQQPVNVGAQPGQPQQPGGPEARPPYST